MYPDFPSPEENDWCQTACHVACQTSRNLGFSREIAKDSAQQAMLEGLAAGRQDRSVFNDQVHFVLWVRQRSIWRSLTFSASGLKFVPVSSVAQKKKDCEDEPGNSNSLEPTVGAFPNSEEHLRFDLPGVISVTLPEQHRDILRLRYWEGLSEKEIAVELGVSQGTVKSRLSRAKTNLREQLEHAGYTDENCADASAIALWVIAPELFETNHATQRTAKRTSQPIPSAPVHEERETL